MSPEVQDAVVAFVSGRLTTLRELHVAWAPTC
jgi:hypothetical protein